MESKGRTKMTMKKFKMLNIICESCELSGKEKQVAHYFVYKSNKIGSCYPSVKTIAEHCGVSDRTVQRATKALKEKGYIIVIPRFVKGRQSSNEYQLNTLLAEQYEREKEMDAENKTERKTENKKGMDQGISYMETTIDEIIEEFRIENQKSVPMENLDSPPVHIEDTEDMIEEGRKTVIEENIDRQEINTENTVEEMETMNSSSQGRREFQQWLKENVMILSPDHDRFKTEEELRKAPGNNKVIYGTAGCRKINVDQALNMRYVHNHKEPRCRILVKNEDDFWKYRVKYPDILDLIEERREGFVYDPDFEGDYFEEE